jgi:DNA repair exonuclease SbcCD nuclease subunit
MRFLHCSDIHITQDYSSAPFLKLGWRRWMAMVELTVGGRATSYRDAKRTLREIVGDVARHEVDHLLISGDLTAYSTEAEFREAREALGTIADSRTTCSIIPGNHDLFTPNSAKAQRFEKHFGHLLESDLPEYCREGAFPFVHFKGDEAAVVGLRSARVVPIPGLAYGTVGAAQLAGLRDLLEDPRMKHRATLVMVHHGPLNAKGRKDTRMHGLVDGTVLLSMLPGPQFAVVHGHLHHRYHHAATATRPHTFCAGSSTQRGHEGYWVIDVTDGVIRGGVVHIPDLSPQR